MPDIQAEIEKLTLKAGDLLVIRCSPEYTEAIEELFQQASLHIPEGITVLLMPEESSIEILDDENKAKLRRLLE